MRHQAVKVRLQPTTEQQEILSQHFGCARWWWNHALNLCIETYQATGKGVGPIRIERISPQPQDSRGNSIIGFAAPEIEAWIVADWDRSVAQHPDFRSRHERMRYWLSTERNMPFSAPESFSEYDSQRDCCIEKLSEALIESTQFLEDRERNLPIYSKRLHTPAL